MSASEVSTFPSHPGPVSSGPVTPARPSEARCDLPGATSGSLVNSHDYNQPWRPDPTPPSPASLPTPQRAGGKRSQEHHGDGLQA